ncbi:hypothetical protein [Pseudoxanthomonas broegbernensis]|uniref:hypothetical protein n=1 Tax=Pseudoxanthomonas broegbernensis TaxID=83619 RepID=UPI0013915D78|nr:hypothetical protein [Pseudoxanthomonas broegbernensis]MBB6066268.1 hypothetical protein [Pseudoxanthomonas broegbernensis]
MITTLTGLLTFFLGLLLGNWLSIGRDKRKEFNDAVAPIRSWLLMQRDELSPYNKSPSRDEIDLFIHYLRPWQRSSFRRDLDKHRATCQNSMYQDSAGQAWYKSDVPELHQELATLLKYTDRR